jgi:hypothetical protein
METKLLLFVDDGVLDFLTCRIRSGRCRRAGLSILGIDALCSGRDLSVRSLSNGCFGSSEFASDVPFYGGQNAA